MKLKIHSQTIKMSLECKTCKQEEKIIYTSKFSFCQDCHSLFCTYCTAQNFTYRFLSMRKMFGAPATTQLEFTDKCSVTGKNHDSKTYSLKDGSFCFGCGEPKQTETFECRPCNKRNYYCSECKVSKNKCFGCNNPYKFINIQ